VRGKGRIKLINVLNPKVIRRLFASGITVSPRGNSAGRAYNPATESTSAQGMLKPEEVLKPVVKPLSRCDFTPGIAPGWDINEQKVTKRGVYTHRKETVLTRNTVNVPNRLIYRGKGQGPELLFNGVYTRV